jgi:hypothetical protein
MPKNNERAERQYLKEYNKLLTAIFNAQNAWGEALQPIQVLDGVRENATAFTVKTNNTPVIVGTYNTGANVAFGTGTGNSNRFGNRTEIKYVNTDVPYDYTLAIHEGLDNFTVNEELDFAVAERLEVQSQAQTRHMNTKIGHFIGNKAGNPVPLATFNEANVITAFSALSAFYVNKEVIVDVDAFVEPSVYNVLVKADLITTDKNSNVNIDRGTIEYAFGFRIIQTPIQYFLTGNIAEFVPRGIILPFVGISTARAISSEDFDGVALQCAARGGTYVSDENAEAISSMKV